MAKRDAKRLVWAVETMAVDPADHLLEIGCGHGVAVSLICEQLAGGTIIAIDRSEAMVDRAKARNREHIASGKAVLRAITLDEADFGDKQFDKIFAFNVSLFWQQPAIELCMVKGLLRPGGTLYLFHQPPLWHEADGPQEFAERLTGILQDNGFSISEVRFKDLKPVPAVCVIVEAS